MPIHGAYAEFVCLPPQELVPVPSGIDAAEAVSLVLNYITAYQMLHRSAKVRPGQRALIHGASGGVGTALLQLGRYSGKSGIEAIAVDAELGYVYYSDEGFGVRKYLADPEAPDAGRELGTFGTSEFAADHEGISIYKVEDGTGYILVSDQQANRFQIFKREGEPGRPHEHKLIKTVPLSTVGSDGSEVTSLSLGPKFPNGLFVAMSEGRVFHYYSWDQIATNDLRRAPDGVVK